MYLYYINNYNIEKNLIKYLFWNYTLLPCRTLKANYRLKILSFLDTPQEKTYPLGKEKNNITASTHYFTQTSNLYRRSFLFILNSSTEKLKGETKKNENKNQAGFKGTAVHLAKDKNLLQNCVKIKPKNPKKKFLR